jgi:hypothetical protein
MNRIFITMLAAIFSVPVALAEEEVTDGSTNTQEAPAAEQTDPAWTGVYERSGKTIRTGEWMGIAGGSLMVIGGTTAVVGGVNAAAGGLGAVFGSEEGGKQASKGANMVIGGLVGVAAGFVSFQVGPALMAGGTVRQARAIRQVNPSAPLPWLGYSSWVPWAVGLTPSLASFILQPAAYILAGLQKGKNRLHWDARSAARYEQNSKKIQVNLTPITIDGNKGLALVGSF